MGVNPLASTDATAPSKPVFLLYNSQFVCLFFSSLLSDTWGGEGTTGLIFFFKNFLGKVVGGGGAQL